MADKRGKKKDKKKSPFSKGFRKHIRRKKAEIKRITDLEKQKEERKKFDEFVQEIYRKSENVQKSEAVS